jgi:hypothetical protein
LQCHSDHGGFHHLHGNVPLIARESRSMDCQAAPRQLGWAVAYDGGRAVSFDQPRRPRRRERQEKPLPWLIELESQKF